MAMVTSTESMTQTMTLVQVLSIVIDSAVVGLVINAIGEPY